MASDKISIVDGNIWDEMEKFLKKGNTKATVDIDVTGVKELKEANKEIEALQKATAKGRGKYFVTQASALKNMASSFDKYNAAVNSNKSESTIKSLARETSIWANAYEALGGDINKTNKDFKESISDQKTLNALVAEQRKAHADTKGYQFSKEAFESTINLIKTFASNGIDVSDVIKSDGFLEQLGIIKTQAKETFDYISEMKTAISKGGWTFKKGGSSEQAKAFLKNAVEAKNKGEDLSTEKVGNKSLETYFNTLSKTPDGKAYLTEIGYIKEEIKQNEDLAKSENKVKKATDETTKAKKEQKKESTSNASSNADKEINKQKELKENTEKVTKAKKEQTEIVSKTPTTDVDKQIEKQQELESQTEKTTKVIKEQAEVESKVSATNVNKQTEEQQKLENQTKNTTKVLKEQKEINNTSSSSNVDKKANEQKELQSEIDKTIKKEKEQKKIEEQKVSSSNNAQKLNQEELKEKVEKTTEAVKEQKQQMSKQPKDTSKNSIVRSQQEIQKEIEQTDKLLKNQQKWIKTLNGVLNDDNYASSGKKNATDLLRQRYNSVISYRQNPKEYDYEAYAEEKRNVSWYKARQEAKKQKIAESSLDKYEVDVSETDYINASNKLQKELEFQIKALEDDKKQLQSLKKELAQVQGTTATTPNTASSNSKTNQEIEKQKELENAIKETNNTSAENTTQADDAKIGKLQQEKLEYEQILALVKEWRSLENSKANTSRKTEIENALGGKDSVKHLTNIKAKDEGAARLIGIDLAKKEKSQEYANYNNVSAKSSSVEEAKKILDLYKSKDNLEVKVGEDVKFTQDLQDVTQNVEQFTNAYEKLVVTLNTGAKREIAVDNNFSSNLNSYLNNKNFEEKGISVTDVDFVKTNGSIDKSIDFSIKKQKEYQTEVKKTTQDIKEQKQEEAKSTTSTNKAPKTSNVSKTNDESLEKEKEKLRTSKEISKEIKALEKEQRGLRTSSNSVFSDKQIDNIRNKSNIKLESIKELAKDTEGLKANISSNLTEITTNFGGSIEDKGLKITNIINKVEELKKALNTTHITPELVGGDENYKELEKIQKFYDNNIGNYKTDEENLKHELEINQELIKKRQEYKEVAAKEQKEATLKNAQDQSNQDVIAAEEAAKAEEKKKKAQSKKVTPDTSSETQSKQDVRAAEEVTKAEENLNKTKEKRTTNPQPDTNIDGEAKKELEVMEALEKKVGLVTTAVGHKNKAFQEEGVIVQQSVDSEISELGNLINWLDTVKTNVKEISDTPIEIKIDKTNVDNNDLVNNTTKELKEEAVAAKEAHTELGNVRKVVEQIKKDKKTGKSLVSYRVTDENGNTVTYGKNRDKLNSNTTLIDSKKASEDSYKNELKLMSEKNSLEINTISANNEQLASLKVKIAAKEKEIRLEKDLRNVANLNTENGNLSIIAKEIDLTKKLSTEREAYQAQLNVKSQKEEKIQNIQSQIDAYKKAMKEYYSAINQNVSLPRSKQSAMFETDEYQKKYQKMIDLRKVYDSLVEQGSVTQKEQNALVKEEYELINQVQKTSKERIVSEKESEIQKTNNILKRQDLEYEKIYEIKRQIYRLDSDSPTYDADLKKLTEEKTEHVEIFDTLSKELNLYQDKEALENSLISRAQIRNQYAKEEAEYTQQQRKEAEATLKAYEKASQGYYAGKTKEVKGTNTNVDDIDTKKYGIDLNNQKESLVSWLKKGVISLNEYDAAIKRTTARGKDLSSVTSKIGDTNVNVKSFSDIENAYNTLIKLEEKYQTLKTKADMGVATSKELIELQDTTTARNIQLNGIKEIREAKNQNIAATEEEIKAELKYVEAQKKASQVAQDTKANNKRYAEALVSNTDIANMHNTFDNLKTKNIGGDTASYTSSLNEAEQKLKDLDIQLVKGKTTLEEYKKAASAIITPLQQVVSVAKTGDVSAGTRNMRQYVASLTDAKDAIKSTTTAGNITKMTAEWSNQKNELTTVKLAYNSVTGEVKELSNVTKSTQSLLGKFADNLKAKFMNMTTYLMTFVSIYDVWRVFKEGLNAVKDFDTALTEMRKVSDESVESLKQFQEVSFGIGDNVGTTGLQIQQSAADFMRLGETLSEAQESSKNANILFNVSEFESIDDATTALISMKAAYKDLTEVQINDVLNKIGNDFAISTNGLAEALQASASALNTAGNDLYESSALVTAGNQIVQDTDKVGNGMRTIALRLTGTSEASTQLEELGEETDGMITTQSKLRETILTATKVASNGYKGFDIFDDNGNYKSTYEIMQGIADIYSEIVESDKKLGDNKSNLLLETVAGKNRSNIAASIFQSPDILRKAYGEAQNSNGSAQEELEKYKSSMEGALQRFKNSIQELAHNFIDSSFVTWVINLGTTVVSWFNKMSDTIGTTTTAFITLAAAIGTIAVVKTKLGIKSKKDLLSDIADSLNDGDGSDIDTSEADIVNASAKKAGTEAIDEQSAALARNTIEKEKNIAATEASTKSELEGTVAQETSNKATEEEIATNVADTVSESTETIAQENQNASNIEGALASKAKADAQKIEQASDIKSTETEIAEDLAQKKQNEGNLKKGIIGKASGVANKLGTAMLGSSIGQKVVASGLGQSLGLATAGAATAVGAITGVGIAIAGVVAALKVYDWYMEVSGENARKAHQAAQEGFEKSKQTIEDTASELNSVNTQLENTQNEIKSIMSQGTLTFVEQEQINKLTLTTQQLQRQKEALEQSLKAQEKVAAYEAKQLYDTKTEYKYYSKADNGELHYETEQYDYANTGKLLNEKVKNAYNGYMNSLKAGKDTTLDQDLIDAASGQAAEYSLELNKMLSSLIGSDGSVISGYEDIYNTLTKALNNTNALSGFDSFSSLAENVTKNSGLNFDKIMQDALNKVVYSGKEINFGDISESLDKTFVNKLKEAGIDEETINYMFDKKKAEYDSYIASVDKRYDASKINTNQKPNYSNIDNPDSEYSSEELEEQKKRAEKNAKESNKQAKQLKKQVQKTHDELTKYAKANPIDYEVLVSGDPDFSKLDKAISVEKKKMESDANYVGDYVQNAINNTINSLKGLDIDEVNTSNLVKNFEEKVSSVMDDMSSNVTNKKGLKNNLSQYISDAFHIDDIDFPDGTKKSLKNNIAKIISDSMPNDLDFEESKKYLTENMDEVLSNVNDEISDKISKTKNLTEKDMIFSGLAKQFINLQKQAKAANQTLSQFLDSSKINNIGKQIDNLWRSSDFADAKNDLDALASMTGITADKIEELATSDSTLNDILNTTGMTSDYLADCFNNMSLNGTSALEFITRDAINLNTVLGEMSGKLGEVDTAYSKYQKSLEQGDYDTQYDYYEGATSTLDESMKEGNFGKNTERSFRFLYGDVGEGMSNEEMAQYHQQHRYLFAPDTTDDNGNTVYGGSWGDKYREQLYNDQDFLKTLNSKVSKDSNGEWQWFLDADEFDTIADHFGITEEAVASLSEALGMLGGDFQNFDSADMTKMLEDSDMAIKTTGEDAETFVSKQSLEKLIPDDGSYSQQETINSINQMDGVNVLDFSDTSKKNVDNILSTLNKVGQVKIGDDKKIGLKSLVDTMNQMGLNTSQQEAFLREMEGTYKVVDETGAAYKDMNEAISALNYDPINLMDVNLTRLKNTAKAAAEELQNIADKNGWDVDLENYDFNTTDKGVAEQQVTDYSSFFNDKYLKKDGTIDVSVEGYQQAQSIMMALITQKQELNKPAIMSVNVSKIDDKEVQDSITDLQKLITDDNTLDVKLAVGIKDKELESSVKKQLIALKDDPTLKSEGITIDIDKDATAEEVQACLDKVKEQLANSDVIGDLGLGDALTDATDQVTQLATSLNKLFSGERTLTFNVSGLEGALNGEGTDDKQITISVDNSKVEPKVEETKQELSTVPTEVNTSVNSYAPGLPVLETFNNEKEKAGGEETATIHSTVDGLPQIVGFLSLKKQAEIPVESRVTTTGDNTDANQKLDTTKEKASEVEGINPEVIISGNDFGALSAIDSVSTRLNSLDGKKATVTIHENTIKTITNGDGEANGTAKIKASAYVSGSAFADGTPKKGDWRTGNDGVALGGELGEELVVRDGKFFTIGSDGAEFFKHKKNDIIFNASQTASLFKYGGIKGANPRGKAFASGSAFPGGTGGSGGGRTGYDVTGGKVVTVKSDNSATNKNTDTTNKNTDTTNKNTDTTSDNTSAVEKSSQAFDLIERKITWAANKTKAIVDQITDYVNYSTKQSLLNKQIKSVEAEIKVNQKAEKAYQKKANKVKLSKEWKTKIRNGEYSIKDIDTTDIKYKDSNGNTQTKENPNKKLVENIQKYQDYYDKVVSCKQQVVELQNQQKELQMTRMQNVVDNYKRIEDSAATANSYIEKQISLRETLGNVSNSTYYNKMNKNNNTQITQLQKQNAQLKLMQKQVKKGSDAWNEYKSTIEANNVSILELTTNIRENYKTIANMPNTVADTKIDNKAGSQDKRSSKSSTISLGGSGVASLKETAKSKYNSAKDETAKALKNKNTAYANYGTAKKTLSTKKTKLQKDKGLSNSQKTAIKNNKEVSTKGLKGTALKDAKAYNAALKKSNSAKNTYTNKQTSLDNARAYQQEALAVLNANTYVKSDKEKAKDKLTTAQSNLNSKKASYNTANNTYNKAKNKLSKDKLSKTNKTAIKNNKAISLKGLKGQTLKDAKAYNTALKKKNTSSNNYNIAKKNVATAKTNYNNASSSINWTKAEYNAQNKILNEELSDQINTTNIRINAQKQTAAAVNSANKNVTSANKAKANADAKVTNAKKVVTNAKNTLLKDKGLSKAQKTAIKNNKTIDTKGLKGQALKDAKAYNSSLSKQATAIQNQKNAVKTLTTAQQKLTAAKEADTIATNNAVQSEADLAAKRVEVAKQTFANIKTAYENKQNYLGSASTKAQTNIDTKNANGKAIVASDYQAQINAANAEKSNLIAEQTALQNNLNASVKNGTIKKYSSEWYELQSQLDSVTNSIATTGNSIAELNRTKLELNLNNLKNDATAIQNKQAQKQNSIDTANAKGVITSKQDYLDLIYYTLKSTENLQKQNSELEILMAGLDKNSELYQKYADELNSNNQAIQQNTKSNIEYNNSIINLPLERLEKELELLDSIASYNKSKVDLITAKGVDLGDNDYLTQITDIQNEITKQEAERDEAYRNMQNAAANGGVYGGKNSDEWKKDYLDYKTSINSSLSDIEQLKDSWREDIEFRTFDRAIEKSDHLRSQLQSIGDLISDEMMFDTDTGKFTDFGITKMALTIKDYEQGLDDVRILQEKIAKIQSMHGKDGYSELEYTTDLNKAEEDLASKLKDTYSARTAIIEVVKNQMSSELDALGKLIDARKDALQKKKDYYDYDKSLKSKNKEINLLKQQINALNGVTDAESKAQKAKLEAQLQDVQDDLQDTVQEHIYQIQVDGLDGLQKDLSEANEKYVKDLATNFDKIKDVINNATDLSTASFKTVGGTIEALLKQYGVSSSQLGISSSNYTLGGHANGGVVSDLSSAIKANGDSVLISANPGETVLTEDFTKLMPFAIDKMKDFVKMPSIPNGAITKANLQPVEINIGETAIYGANDTDILNKVASMQTAWKKSIVNDLYKDARKYGYK